MIYTRKDPHVGSSTNFFFFLTKHLSLPPGSRMVWILKCLVSQPRVWRPRVACWLLPSFWKTHIHDCIGLWHMNYSCCLYACWDLLCSFLSGVCWGLRVSALQNVHSPGFEGDPPVQHCYGQKAVSLLDSLPQRRLWRRRGGVTITPWLPGTALPAVANGVLPLTLMSFCSSIALLFALNYLFTFPN